MIPSLHCRTALLRDGRLYPFQRHRAVQGPGHPHRVRDLGDGRFLIETRIGAHHYRGFLRQTPTQRGRPLQGTILLWSVPPEQEPQS